MSVEADKKSSYDQVLKSTSIMGGAAGINMLFSLLRAKFAAVLIGTFGVGLIANLTIIQGLVSALSGLGLQTSAVRDVVAARESSDEKALGKICSTTIRMCVITGLIGLIAVAFLSEKLSVWTFGSSEYSLHIACLGVIVFLSNLTGGYQAIIQGARRVDSLAKINIVTSFLGTLTSISLFYLFGTDGIIPALIATSLTAFCASWYFFKRLNISLIRAPWRNSFLHAGGMIRLGSAMMAASVLVLIGKYVTNALLTKEISLEAVGIYSAAFALSTILVDFVLTAMNTDYYPRLISAGSDKGTMCNLIAEQVEVGLLIVTPGLIFTLSFAPWIVESLYTEEFLPAVELLNWLIIAGMASVLSRPAGYVLIALGKSAHFLLTTILLQGFYILFLVLALDAYGLIGSAIAFVILRLVHVMVMMAYARRLISFSLPRDSESLVLRCIAPVVVLFGMTNILPAWLSALAGSIMFFFSLHFTLISLKSRLDPEHAIIRKLGRIGVLRKFLS